MNRYVLLSKDPPHFFKADDDEDAELYVESHFDEDDGEMELFRLEPIMKWPD